MFGIEIQVLIEWVLLQINCATFTAIAVFTETFRVKAATPYGRYGRPFMSQSMQNHYEQVGYLHKDTIWTDTYDVYFHKHVVDILSS